MNIISKYKDYYDYLVGIYGVDIKIVLDRRKFDKYEILETDDKILRVHVCDMIYDGRQIGGKFYWGYQLLDLLSEKHLEDFNNSKHKNKVGGLFINPYPCEKKLNTLNNCPIMLDIDRRNWNDDFRFLLYPILKEIGIASVLPPKEIYLMLTEWLSPKENIPDNRTNNEKILTNGFDLKSSFRHPIK